jgi:CheY-like chemotaxis protein
MKILMVDDDQFLISLYKKKAETSGVELQTALSGQEALDILKGGFSPDVVALDITMAGMSGIDVLKYMRANKLADGARVAILSNTADESVMNEAKALGADKFIFKASLLPSQVFDELMSIVKG